MTQSKRIVARLKKLLAPKGFDVVIPLSVESYNAYLETASGAAAFDLTRFRLPVPSPACASSSNSSADEIDATSAPSPSPRSSSLLVLVGNSRALWPPFLEFVKREMAQSQDARVLRDPVDRYVQQSIRECLDELSSACDDDDGDGGVLAPEKVYWVADTEPGKMILAQKMALAAKHVSHCPPSQLCLHPTFGPWLAFRCALVFAAEGIEATSNTQSGQQQEPPLCRHDEPMHQEIAELMEQAFAQAKSYANGTTSSISPDAWRAWVLPRITMAPNHPMSYSSEQILYHYTKDLGFLAKVVDAHFNNKSTDYLRSAPSQKVVECRSLLQQVLGEYQTKFPDGIDGILLSGGLDTSILAEASAQKWDCEDNIGRVSLDKHGDARPILAFKHAFTLQARPEAQDAVFAANIYERLRGVSLDYHHVVRDTLEDLLLHAPRATKILATCDPMELRNSLVIYATLAKAAELRVKQVVTGDAADEIFCGYSFYHRMDEEALMAYRLQIIQVMQFTASKLAQSFGIEVLSPFLDPRVVKFAQSLSKADLIGERTPVPIEGGSAMHGKLVLRQAFPESFSQWRSKQPIEEGSGTTALRMGYFDTRWTKHEFEQLQKEIFQRHRVFVRDNEHLFFCQAFLDAFDQDLSNVPKQRCLVEDTSGAHSGEEKTVDEGFCPACYFELSHKDQDFCVTCGFWPTKPTPTNDAKGYATQALRRLAQDKQRLLCAYRVASRARALRVSQFPICRRFDTASKPRHTLQHTMVVVTATLSFIGIALVKGATAVYVRYDNNKQYALMKTNAPLLEHETLDREKFARSEAELGFNECQACGFENFKRIAFCTICGEPLSSKSKKRAKKTKVPANTLDSRTKRARKRKEWLRSASTEGWVRQAQTIDQADARFPGFVATFRFEEAGDSATPAAGGDDGKTASLIEESKRAHLDLVEASKANPWAGLPDELKQEALEIAKLDFPHKNAVFVTKSVAALAPAKKQLLQLTLDRGFLLENSLEHISCIDAKNLRAELSLKFLKTKGPVTGKMNRDWIAQLNELLVNQHTGLFQLANKSDQTFYINKNSKSAIGDDHLTFYYAAGRLLGRGLLDGTLWGFHLATPLLKIILGIPVSFTDLEFFDPEEYKNLQWLVHNSGVESLGLDFSVAEKSVDGEVVLVDLIPNGRNIAVTDANRFEYLERRFKYTLFESVSEQLYAFLKGIYEVVPPDMLLPLDTEELDFIMCGTDVIDVDDWKIHSKNNECIHGHPCMRWFWKFVRRMPLEYKKRLLHFTTGNTRVPLGGFAALTNYNGLVAPFTIVGNELVHSRLIRGMPCFNHIELPNYVHKRDLKAALFGILDNYEYVK